MLTMPWCAHIPLPWQLLCSVLALLQLHWLCRPDTAFSLQPADGHLWRLSLANVEPQRVVIAAFYDFHCCCIVAVSQSPDELADGQRPQRWRWLLWCDQLSAADWRRFRVSLRWRRKSLG